MTKICFTCKREFVASSRHKNCPSCRGNARKHPCECGTLIFESHTKCITCHNRNLARGAEGRTRHKKGYVLIRKTDHPKASSNNGYVFEHRLVMEERIGRYLLDSENVHHINGVRDDNRIENLELWCKPQPTGVRAEDAYKHALEIIERYGDLFASPTNTD